jgi:putative tricarboxylic transport membrane protein
MVIGLAAGIIIGALPGLSGPLGIALLIPLTFGWDPLVALGLLAGVHNGASYGCAIPAILLRIPGTSAAIFTVFDGFPLAQKGMAGAAVRIAAISSAVGGVLSSLGLIFLTPPLALLTLSFGPAEIFWVTVFGLAAVSILLGDAPLKGAASACVGLLISLIGFDRMNGHERFTFGVLQLLDGPMLIVILTGLFALPPAWEMAERGITTRLTAAQLRFKDTPGLWSVRSLWRVWIQSSVIGIITGLLPGTSGGMGSAIAYNEAKRVSKKPEEFGKGSPEGLAASECCNNADNAVSLVPALTLGVPGSSVAALILGALLVHGLQPGPALFRDHADVVYGYMLQMLITSALILPAGGFIATRVFAQVLRLPQVLLAALVVAMSVVGVYTVNNSMFDVYMLIGWGVVGYGMERLRYPLAPLVLGLVLGSSAEYQLRLALRIGGDWTTLFTRPISDIIIVMTALIIFFPIYRYLKDRPAKSQALSSGAGGDVA